MGWLFSRRWSTKKALIEHLTAEQRCSRAVEYGGGPVAQAQGSMKTLAKSLHGNRLWTVMQGDYPDHPELNEKFILLFLLASDRTDGWGYKDIAETSGPAYYDCPLKFLEMVPEPDHNYGWRKGVRDWHAGKREQADVAKTIAAGQRWMLNEKYGAKACEIVRPAPRHKGQWYAKIEGETYRVRPSMLARQMGKKEVTASEFFADPVVAAAVRVANAATMHNCGVAPPEQPPRAD